MENNCLTQTFACGLMANGRSAETVGSKAANLIRMADAGLPVPPGLVITTEVCREFFDRDCHLPEGFLTRLTRDIEHIERATGLSFGGKRRPLLLSVRSGAPVSMPGMMDTILNVGLCDRTLSPLVRMTGNPRFVWDCYRRLVQAHAEVVHGLAPDGFERLIDERMRAESVQRSAELDAFALRDMSRQFLRLYANQAGASFPQDPLQQLTSAIESVFRSWQSPRALEYRRLHDINDRLGTAVTVQAMVFGNMGCTSGSGVAFTRDPSSGEHELYLDFLWNAQGEDVVSGRHAVHDGAVIRRMMPAIYHQLRQIGNELERLFDDVQDFEYTIQEGQLYLLQSRHAKRTPWAALRMVCDLVSEGLIDERVALKRLAEYDLSSLKMIRLAPEHDRPALSTGIPASPGVAVGPIALDPQVAVAMAREGYPPILVRPDISTDDVAGLAASAGILTTLGGRTSHAAVVARQMNKVCIVGCKDLSIQRNEGCRIGGERLAKGDLLSLDGHSGAVYAGKVEVVVERPQKWLAMAEQWRQTQRASRRR